MRHTRNALALLLTLVIGACVTINIYFPAAAAEQAADRIIEDVWGTQPDASKRPAPPAPPAPAPVEPPPQSMIDSECRAVRILNFFVPVAHAQADINIATPAIDRLRASMRQRHGSLEAHYASGGIGLTNDGLIAVRDQNAIALKDRTAVRQLVADENNDRNALYREIARANGHPEWEAEIRQTFARRWIDNAASGWWHQDSGGNWRQK
jgi:uncharacterized protein